MPGAPPMPAWMIAGGVALWVCSMTCALAGPAPQRQRNVTVPLLTCMGCVLVGLPLIVLGRQLGCWSALAGALLLNLTIWLLRASDDDGGEPHDPRPDPPAPSGDGIDWDEFDRQRRRWSQPEALV